jgi:RHS repeat-associated protein
VSYGYDAVGNRTSLVQGATSETYSYDPFSNQLFSVTAGATTRSFTYDGAGNVTADDQGGAVFGLAYNNANRFARLSINGTPDTDYRYNALGQRVVKQDAGLPATAKHYHYDRDGNLIAETNAAGGLIREYAWLDGLPLATVEAGALRHIHADHLGTPQKLTDSSQAIVWDGVFDPFGEEMAITGLATMPMRFPGQYADDETGFSYNYFRDYDPNLGRYVQPDPIGLLGGLNRYAYVGGNPVNTTDPKGQRAISQRSDPSRAKQPRTCLQDEVIYCHKMTVAPLGGLCWYICDDGSSVYMGGYVDGYCPSVITKDMAHGPWGHG